MPSRSVSRGRKRRRSSSRGSGMYAAARVSRSRSMSRASSKKFRGAHMPSLNMHCYSRYALNPLMVSVSSTTSVASINWTFDQVAGYSEFVSMYDQYKISKVIMRVQLVNNPDASAGLNSASGTTTNWFPKFWYVRDYDGGGSDTISQLKERQGAKFFVLKPNVVKNIVIRPMVTVQTYRTSTTTGYSPKKLYIDMANGTDVPHYGLNYVVDCLGQDPSDTFPFVVRFEYKFYFACKGAR